MILLLSPLEMELFPLISRHEELLRRNIAFGELISLPEAPEEEAVPAFCITGMGKIRSALTVSRVLGVLKAEEREPAAVILAGIGGAAGSEALGCVNVAKGTLQWDLGMLPFAKTEGLYPDGSGYEATDPLLSDCIAAELERRGFSTTRGTAYTGDTFLRGVRKAHIQSPGTVDMESSSFLAAVKESGIPAAVIRIVSDEASGRTAGNLRDFIDREIGPLWDGAIEGALTFLRRKGIVP
jgi:adenosylhomocysteine nucleosidase